MQSESRVKSCSGFGIETRTVTLHLLRAAADTNGGVVWRPALTPSNTTSQLRRPLSMTVGVHSSCCRYSVYSTCALYSQHGAEEPAVHRWLCCRRQSTVLTAPSARHLLPACDTAHAATSPPCHHHPRTWYTVAQLGGVPRDSRGEEYSLPHR